MKDQFFPNGILLLRHDQVNFNWGSLTTTFRISLLCETCEFAEHSVSFLFIYKVLKRQNLAKQRRTLPVSRNGIVDDGCGFSRRRMFGRRRVQHGRRVLPRKRSRRRRRPIQQLLTSISGKTRRQYELFLLPFLILNSV